MIPWMLGELMGMMTTLTQLRGNLGKGPRAQEKGEKEPFQVNATIASNMVTEAQIARNPRGLAPRGSRGKGIRQKGEARGKGDRFQVLATDASRKATRPLIALTRDVSGRSKANLKGILLRMIKTKARSTWTRFGYHRLRQKGKEAAIAAKLLARSQSL